MRICKLCNIEKELIEFPQKNNKPNSYYCKKCFYKKYKETSINSSRNYYKENSEICIIKSKEYRDNNVEILKDKKKVYYENNKEEINKKSSEYCKENRGRRNELAKINYNNNIEENREKKNNYIKEKMLNDKLFKLSFSIRSLIRNALKRGFTEKSKRTTEILGCSFEEFKIHLESMFCENMNWDNQGIYWHMDHIKPISLASTKEEVYELNNYTNFQPLYWKDNLEKGNKY